MDKVSLVFSDDHPILLDGMVALFAKRAEYVVVGKARDAEEALAVTLSEKPNILILDLSMPGDVFGTIGRIVHDCSGTKIIAFTASESVNHAVRALEAGASGYVLKGSAAEELDLAIRSVLAGEIFVTPSFAMKVITALRAASQTKQASRQTRLSVREDQIVKLLLRGYTNREIALHLHISEKTVKHYMSVLMQKLNVRNRLEVVIAAQKMARLSDEPQTGHWGDLTN